MPSNLFEFPSVPVTVDSIKRCIADIDVQLDEIADKVGKLQAARRALAELSGVDRREGVGTFGEMADAARRSEYEGGSTDRIGRLVPRGKAAS